MRLRLMAVFVFIKEMSVALLGFLCLVTACRYMIQNKWDSPLFGIGLILAVLLYFSSKEVK